MKTNVTTIARIVGIALVIIIFQSVDALAQNKGNFIVSGQAIKDDKPHKNALVTLYHDPYGNNDYWPVDQFMTNGNAKFKFKLDYNSTYMLEVAALGGIHKTLFIETDVLPGLLDSDQEFAFIVDFTQLENLEDLNTVAKITFREEAGKFDYDLLDDVSFHQAGGE